MLPLYEEPYFTFRFADDRVVGRFHLGGVGPGRRVRVVRLDPATGERRELLAEAVVGDGGWVELAEPIAVHAGDGFVAVPEACEPDRPSPPCAAPPGYWGEGDG